MQELMSRLCLGKGTGHLGYKGDKKETLLWTLFCLLSFKA